jgi:hypothetical protein
MSITRAKFLAAALMLCVASACGSGRAATPVGGADQATGQQPPSPEGSVVQILNTSPGSVSITAYMVPDGAGVDTPLGTVESGQIREFAFNGAPGRYRIRTVGAAGEMSSDIFQLYRNSNVRWDMSLGRRVQVSQRGR